MTPRKDISIAPKFPKKRAITTAYGKCENSLQQQGTQLNAEQFLTRESLGTKPDSGEKNKHSIFSSLLLRIKCLVTKKVRFGTKKKIHKNIVSYVLEHAQYWQNLHLCYAVWYDGEIYWSKSKDELVDMIWEEIRRDG
jgi:hypothetical protein